MRIRLSISKRISESDIAWSELTKSGRRQLVIRPRARGINKLIQFKIGGLPQSGVSLYLLDSNSCMMSSEIATYLTGRYVSFRIFTLAFEEHLTFY